MLVKNNGLDFLTYKYLENKLFWNHNLWKSSWTLKQKLNKTHNTIHHQTYKV